MAELGKSLKAAWMKGMEAIGNTASSIASNTKTKVQEMNLINRRREILSDFGAQAYEMWQKGENFPEKLEKQLRELSQLDEELNVLRTERLAGVKTDEKADEPVPEAAEDAGDPVDAESGVANRFHDIHPRAEVPTLRVRDDDVPIINVPEQAPAEDVSMNNPVPTLDDLDGSDDGE